MKLTKEHIHRAQTSNRGFTHAQIEFLGHDPKEKWIEQCIGLDISEQDYATFVSYQDVDAKQLKLLKLKNLFNPILLTIAYNLNQKRVWSGVNYQDGSPICVGDAVEFEWNETIGMVKAEVRFVAPSFVGVVVECKNHKNLIGANTGVSSLWKRL